ncbi:MAG: hypothetical protein K2X81_21175 [Candidatus Obscuribacterales bacterium]|nr:hypothetical protein [Candidatus Obscuribacterales bacterium]
MTPRSCAVTIALLALLMLAINTHSVPQALGQAECAGETFVIKKVPPKVEPELVSQSFLLRSSEGVITELLVTPPALSLEEQSDYYGDKAGFADLLSLLRAKKKLSNVQEVVLKGKLSTSENALLETCTLLECLEADSVSGLRLNQFQKLKKLKVHNADLQALESASKLKNLEEILFRNIKENDSAIAKLSTLSALRVLDLQFVPNSHISPDTISLFRACKQLTDFAMLGVHVTDEMAGALAKIKSLRCLFLDKPDEDKEKFDRLCKIIGTLPDLYIFNYLNIVCDRDIQTCLFFPHLRSLGVSDIPQLSEKSIEVISGLKQLRFLNIRNSQLPENGLDKLCSLPVIESITLDSTKLNIKRALTPMAPSKRVSMELTSTDIDDVSLCYLAKLSYFSSLNLRQTKISNDGLTCLRDVTLPNIDVSFTNVSEAGIETLLSNSSVRSISAYKTKFNPLLREGLKVIESAKEHSVNFQYAMPR